MTARPQCVTVPVRRLPGGEGLPLPAYVTEHAAGMDLMAAVSGEVVIAPGGRQLVATGISIALPAGFEAQVRPRSGLAVRHGLTVLNAPGTIDTDYRGEIAVVLANLGAEPFTVTRGMRIAQLVVGPIARVAWQEVDALPRSRRGPGGFGSTGGFGEAQAQGERPEEPC